MQIHNESLELTKFKCCFSPFDLDNLEAKVCRLTHGNRDEEDVAEPKDAPQICFTDPRMLNMEEYKGMSFDENNYSPIPPVSRVTSQNIDPRPTSTPKPAEVQQLNISDPTHTRGKINRINSFDTAQEWVRADASKGGPFKSSGTKGHPQPSGSNEVESHRPQLNCTTCGDVITSGKTVMRMFSAIDAEPDPTLQRCAESPTQPATGNTICLYCGSVNHTSGKCHNKPNNNRE